jgi:hypothetical protein
VCNKRNKFCYICIFKSTGDGGKPPVNSIVGSITDWHAVESACTGVTSVIHVAGLISFGTFPDNSRMEKVNIAGMNIYIQRNLQFTVVATTLRTNVLIKPFPT